MAASDKTRQKLVDSMQKATRTPATKTPQKRASSSKAAAKKTKPTAKNVQKDSIYDRYQSSRRVWPD